MRELKAFIAVADCSSFTLAAKGLATSKSSVARAIQSLEERLGTSLLERSTRAVRLTDEGLTYLESVRSALHILTEAGLLASARQSEPTGRLRVELPNGLGRTILSTLAGFRKHYPKIILELGFSDKFSSIIDERWDLVVRVGELDDSSLVAKKLCQLRFGLYASPAYLAGRGTPCSPAELIDHDHIVFRSPSGLLKPWLLNDQGKIVEISPTPRLILTNSRALIDAAAEGLGIAFCFNVTAVSAIMSGQVVQILPETASEGPPVHVLFPHGRSKISNRARAFMEHLEWVLASFKL